MLVWRVIVVVYSLVLQPSVEAESMSLYVNLASSIPARVVMHCTALCLPATSFITTEECVVFAISYYSFAFVL
jgi:hypothetical protein